MNALYADADGKVVDPLGGLPDHAGAAGAVHRGRGHRASPRITCASCAFSDFTRNMASDRGIDPEGLAAVAAQSGRAGQRLRASVSAPRCCGCWPRRILRPRCRRDGAGRRAGARSAGRRCARAGAAGASGGAGWRGARCHAPAGRAGRRGRARPPAPEQGRCRAARRCCAAPSVAWRAPARWAIATARRRRATSCLLRAALLEHAAEPGRAGAGPVRGAAAEFPISARDLMPELRGRRAGRAPVGARGAMDRLGFCAGPRQDLLERHA